MRLRRGGVIWLAVIAGLSLVRRHTVQVVPGRCCRRRGRHRALVTECRVNGQWLRVRYLVSPLIRAPLVGHAHEAGCTGRWSGECVGAIKTGPRATSHGGRLRHVGGHWSLQTLVLQARVLGRRRGSSLGSRSRTLQTPRMRVLHNLVGSGLVGWVVQQAANVVHK